MAKRFLIGIDEVGRGPLAGPVAVGVAMATPATIKKFKAIKESKQLSRARREEWYAKICAEGSGVAFVVACVSARTIDKRGIAPCIRSALARGLKKLSPDPKRVRVLLDGGLCAPEEFTDQETIIRGDTKETIIAIASVVAKVERDRMMFRLDKKYPAYGFERHVGYGTKAHIRALQHHGFSPIHRRSFCKNILVHGKKG